MTLNSFVCVILFQVLLVTAFPTSNGEGEGDPGVAIELPVSGEAEFHGTAQATGSVTIVGHAPCHDPEFPASLNPISPKPQTVEKENAPAFTEFDENCPSKDYDEIKIDQIPRKVILGAILADSMAEKSAEIDAQLAELDAFVESEIGTIGPIIQSALTNADTSKIDACVDSALIDMESQINSVLTELDEFVDSELSKTEKLVESVIRKVGAETEEKIIAESAEKVKLELPTLESFVESILDKSEPLMESELEKVNTLVESEMEKIDSIVESQLDKVDLFIEKELEKTDALVKTEMLKMESLVENEMAKVEKSMEDMADASNAESNAVFIISNLDGTIIQQTNEDQVGTIVIDGTFPVSGRTIIIGNTGCPPPFPTGEPLPLYVESFPVFENVDYELNEPVFASGDKVYEDVEDGCTIHLPIAGKAVFNGVAPATGTCKIMADFPCDSALPPINNNVCPPKVGDANPRIPLNQAPSNKPYFTMSGSKEDYAGTGPPLTATEVGPDGKKYIWIGKKANKKCNLENTCSD